MALFLSLKGVTFTDGTLQIAVSPQSNELWLVYQTITLVHIIEHPVTR